ncbi:hypothetical protein DICPUDRAFT_77381 [Dictyostelium purpureum]|uniref:GATA-type domain-containing protein n=1 Tax=Dictyostelium purpureum TaxID=5786 RepID=F0ZGF8_DICPU|nr:uncharacterized protein DICPUDRAFT_77381 [Dictyostelium purpureum]EGC37005.1 hypothetical protein DICPUDRAFT_77381 [Dictyostelium purpureum]|eukprot:XP_003286502.1 hypothetical protein DICPUDRAFT_77381 [Dictyostelium purpureum]
MSYYQNSFNLTKSFKNNNNQNVCKYFFNHFENSSPNNFNQFEKLPSQSTYLPQSPQLQQLQSPQSNFIDEFQSLQMTFLMPPPKVGPLVNEGFKSMISDFKLSGTKRKKGSKQTKINSQPKAKLTESKRKVGRPKAIRPADQLCNFCHKVVAGVWRKARYPNSDGVYPQVCNACGLRDIKDSRVVNRLIRKFQKNPPPKRTLKHKKSTTQKYSQA